MREPLLRGRPGSRRPLRPAALLLGVAILVAVVALVAIERAQERWSAAAEDMRRTLRSAAPATGGSPYREDAVASLPSPVARYFRAALRDGQPLVKRVRISWRGEFNTGRPGHDAWKPFTAAQEFLPGAPGFVWDARIATAPGLPVLVRDGFVGGAGSMRASILGLITMLDVSGTEAVTRSALQRYLAEAAWFPTALFPGQGVSWAAIDERRARASLTAGSTTVALEFRFGGDGLIESIYAPDRFYDDGVHPPVARPWLARILRYQVSHGMKLPAAGVVEWELPEGAFPYWRGSPREIELDYLAAP
jgi:hypothetical protein